MEREVQDKYDELLNVAQSYMNRAYAPYSKVHVGSAVLSGSGKIYGGCNVENASFGLTNCAERVALQTMIANGEKQFKAILITSNLDHLLYPCGACRQVMTEFKGKFDPYVFVVGKNGLVEIERLSSLIPYQVTDEEISSPRDS